MWTHFSYKSGANPYIAKNDVEKRRILNKYKGKTKQIGDDMYEINDIPDNITKWLCNEFYSILK